jgi:hypothetical protein
VSWLSSVAGRTWRTAEHTSAVSTPGNDPKIERTMPLAGKREHLVDGLEVAHPLDLYIVDHLLETMAVIDYRLVNIGTST